MGACSILGGLGPALGSCTFQWHWASQARRYAWGSSQQCHLGAPIYGRGWVSLPAPFCLLPPPSPRAGVPGTGSRDKQPELGHRQGKASCYSHKTSHGEAGSAGLGAGRWCEAVLNTGLRRIGVFALGQGHPY